MGGAIHLLFHNQGRGRPIGGGDEATYADKILAMESANLIAYWPQSESSGIIADNAEGTAARDGAYTGVTLGQLGIGDGWTCPLFDGVNDFNKVYSTSLNTAYIGTAGSIFVWAKVSGAGVWTDLGWRRAIEIGDGGSNKMVIFRPSTNGNLQWEHKGNGTSKTVTKAGLSTTAWMHLGLTWDDGVADEAKMYYNGEQEGVTQTGLGNWAGNLSATFTNVGCNNNAIPAHLWSGYLAHAAIWTKVLTPAQITSLYSISA